MTSSPGSESLERFDAPLYLARFRARQQQQQHAQTVDDITGTRDGNEPTATTQNGDEPLYLKRFRQRAAGRTINQFTSRTPGAGPLWKRGDLTLQQVLTEDNRNKEISPPATAARRLLNDVFLIRHGETQGYSTDSGLTPQGAWQAHTYGRTMARRISAGETVVLRHAPTNRARQTAEQIHRGLADGLNQYEKEVRIVKPEAMEEFRNFGFAAPAGITDVTAAFRQYHSLLEAHERSAAGDRPTWLVEMDRFWRTQEGGGDPIGHWLTTPLLHFEPPSMTVRRFWMGIERLSEQFPGARLSVSTHSGCIRAFAVSALGYDPGEPYNVEHVRVKLLGFPDRQPETDPDPLGAITPQHDGDDGAAPLARGAVLPRRAAASGRYALVTYRNRVQEVHVPDVGRLPTWSPNEGWPGFSGS